VEATAKLKRGVPVTGKVVETETRKGIPDAEIYYLSDTPEFRESMPGWTAKTKADGSFRVLAPPGKARLFLPFAPDGYLGDHVVGSVEQTHKRFVRAIEIKVGQPVKTITFALDRGMVIDGRATDPQGKPVPAVEVRMAFVMRDSGHRSIYVTGHKDGKFSLSGLEAGQEYWIALSNKQGTLKALLTLTPPADKKRVDLPVKLLRAATVSGRVLDEEDKPIVGATVQAYTPWTPRAFEATSTTLTGADGKFRLTNVLPGHPISVSASAEGYLQDGSGIFDTAAGKDKAAGDLVLRKLDQAVAGVIIDQNNKPVVGVEVQPVSQSIGTRSITDKNGRFRITRLPRGPVEIRGMVPWDRERSAFTQRVEAGTTNAKIVVRRPTDP
jgi:hypothetical protein